MAMGLGRRAMRIAVLAGALSAAAGSLGEQPLRQQLIELATTIELEADELSAELEFSDDTLTLDLHQHA